MGQSLLMGGIPTWWAQIIIPVGFGLMASRFGLRAVLFSTGRLEARAPEELL